MRLGLNISISARALSARRWAVVQTRTVRWQVATLHCVGAVSDLLIAGTIATALVRLRSGSSRDKLVDRLVAFAVGAPLCLPPVLAED